MSNIRIVIAAVGLALLANGGALAQAATPGSDYLIGPGDQLQVFVFNHPELSVSVPVRPDGYVSTPLVEDIQAVGKTPTQLARDMEVKLAEYVRSPTVNVIVTSFVGQFQQQVRVVGQVTNPQALSFRNGMTVLDVVLAVGGLTEFAAGNRARLIRQTADGPTEIRVRLEDVIEGDIEKNVAIEPGDILSVPESVF